MGAAAQCPTHLKPAGEGVTEARREGHRGFADGLLQSLNEPLVLCTRAMWTPRVGARCLERVDENQIGGAYTCGVLPRRAFEMNTSGQKAAGVRGLGGKRNHSTAEAAVGKENERAARACDEMIRRGVASVPVLPSLTGGRRWPAGSNGP